MQMTVEEIIRNYTQAKDKSKQIGILADLNGCDKEKIRSILRTKGVPLPTKGRPKKEREVIKTDLNYDKAKKTVTIKNLSTGETITKPLDELVVKKDEFESPMRPIEAVIEGTAVQKVTFINKDTGEKTTQVFDETEPHEETPILPTSVRTAIQDKIQALELEKMRITLEQEELEDFLEQFADDV